MYSGENSVIDPFFLHPSILICFLGIIICIVYRLHLKTFTLPRRTQVDLFAEATQMAANRAEWTRINREAMEAWEDACNCRPPAPRLTRHDRMVVDMKNLATEAKWRMEYMPSMPSPFALHYNNPHSAFDAYMRDHYCGPTPYSAPSSESTPSHHPR
jgi:hypothetical protein